MTIDIFRDVLFNDGEELTHGDLNNMQTVNDAKFLDQFLEELAPAIDETAVAMDFNTIATDPAPSGYAYALRSGRAYAQQGSGNNKIKISPGTLLQKIDTNDGGNATLVPFTFDGSIELTIANGDVTNPRVDLLQMKLEYVDQDPENRIFDTDPVKSSLNLATVTTHVNTVIRAKVPGKSGNNISIAFAKRTSGSGVTYSESGNAITVQYEDGVSTVANVETAFAASTLIEIQSAGTPGNVLHDPADTFTTTHLINGADRLLVTQSMNKTHRIKCTLSIKQGTPAASPTYPLPDTGFVPVFGIVVGTNYVGAAGLKWRDTAGAVAVVHDLRMPLRVRAYRVDAKDWIYDASWTLTGAVLIGGGAPTDVRARCPGGTFGRLLAVELASANFTGGGGQNAHLAHEVYSAGLTLNNINLISSILNNNANLDHVTFRWFAFESTMIPEAGPTVQRGGAGAPHYGPPVWTSGLHVPFPIQDLGVFPRQSEQLSIVIHPNSATPVISHVTFYVLEGV